MLKDIIHTRVVSTILIVACIVISAGMAGFLLDLFNTGGVSANKFPVAEAGGGPLYGYPNVPLEFNGTGSSDPDGEIFSLEWDFGDGFTGIGLKPTHIYMEAGEYSVVLTVKDNDGAESTDTITAIIVDDPEGTGMYELVTVNDILTDGNNYFEKLVRVEGALVSDSGSFASGYGSDPSGWVKFDITDSSTTSSIEVYCEGGATRPLDLYDGDSVNVYAMLDKYSGAWELNVRKDTTDRVVLAPSFYNNYTLGELVADRLSHYGELVRIQDMTITDVWAYGWDATDATTTETISLYAEVNANVSKYVNVSDEVLVQGVFTYYDYDKDGPDDDEWEIKIRNAGDDKVMRTYEFDYPPTFGAVKITPADPSPYSVVTVNATIADNVGVVDADLFYRFGTGSWTSVTMTRSVGNYWIGQIPAATAGTNVSYYITATDAKDQVGQSDTMYYLVIDHAPVIHDVVQHPQWVRPPDTVNISANITDDGGITEAGVVYSDNGWNSSVTVTLADDGTGADTAAGDDEFWASLGSFPDGTNVEYYVYAKDSNSQTAYTENFSFISSYDQAPIVGGVYRNIELPKAVDSVKIITNVTDDFLLLNVTLYYDNGTGLVAINMTKRADGNYEATIPPQPSQAVVRYYVNSTDNGSHTVKFPATPFAYFVDYGVPAVLYDTGHGEYVGSMDYFANVVSDSGYYWMEGDINEVNLDWVEFIIINDPESDYTTAEKAMLQTFIQNGGGLMLLSETDYSEYGRPENCNPILASLGIEGRFNDDGYQDDWYCFDMWNYSSYMPYIPYFNYYERWNDSFTDLGCFAADTTGITDGVMWMEGRSVSSIILNASSDIVVVRGSNQGYSVNNDAGDDEAWFNPYAAGSRPPIMAAHEGIGSGRVLYGGMGSTLGDGNYFGWTDSNLTEFSEGIIEYLVNTPLLSQPEIDNVAHTPIYPSSAETVTITADVTGIGPAISEVNLYYSVNGSYYVKKAMTLDTGNTYKTTIAKQKAGAVVTYYVQVIDASDNIGYWPTEPGISGIGWYNVSGGYHIVLSEVCYDPPGTDGGYEFVELYNPYPAAVSLDGWYIMGQNGNGNWTDYSDPIPSNSIIPAFGFFLLAKDEYAGWGADFIVTITLQNGPSSDPWGDAVLLWDKYDNTVDRLCWDDGVVGGLNTTMYEGWPVLDDGSLPGSWERLPAINDPAGGNYIDTDNNSADFIYRKFTNPQGTGWNPEYPSWVGDITSPFLLPDDHPAKLAYPSSQPVMTTSTEMTPVEMGADAPADILDCTTASTIPVLDTGLVIHSAILGLVALIAMAVRPEKVRKSKGGRRD